MPGPVEGLAQLPRRVLIALVHAYRLLLSPWLGNRCRFVPSCSAYALSALEQHGALRGSALAGWRIVRCQPWCDGGCDPVPHNTGGPFRGLFSRLPTRDAASNPAAGSGAPQ
jgi:uncharacterized protein